MDGRQAESVVPFCRILYNNVVSIFWNAFLSTLSHAPTIEPTGVMDFFNQQVTNSPQLTPEVTLSAWAGYKQKAQWCLLLALIVALF